MMISQLMARPSLRVRYICRPTLLLAGLLLFTATRLSAQPTNDSCAIARVLALPGVGEEAITVIGHNIGATPELPASVLANCTPGGIFSGLGADVWYTFVPSENSCFNFTVAGLVTPEITIRRGTDCYNTLDVLCEASNDGIVSATATLEADSTYYLRVSGANYANQGYFQLTVDRVFCFTEDGCVLLDGLSASPEPNVLYYQEQEILSYNPGTTVNFCYTVDFWLNAGNNWLHSVQIDLGEAWDLNSLTAFPPNSCNGNGEWNWYEEWTSCNTGETFGPGFAYDAQNGIGCGGSPFDFLPGNNYGDGPDQCAIWEFCWTVSVKDCDQIEEEMSSTDLKVEVTALSDGRSGSYNIVACDTEVDATLNVRTGCGSGGGGGDGCLIPIADGATTNVSCTDQMDGTFTIDADDGGLPSNVFLYDLNDNLIEAFIGVQLPFTSPAILDTGYYGVLLETPGIELEGFCPGYFISIINIRLPFEPIADYVGSSDCIVDSVQLSGSILPATDEGVSYDWVGPNDFQSSISDPYVTEPGQYILTVNKDGCRISDTVEVEFRMPIPLQINEIGGPSCVGEELVLTAGGAGPHAENYEWVVPLDSDIAMPVYNPVDFTWEFSYINENVDLQLVGFDSLGCSDTIDYTAGVIFPAFADFSLTGNDLTYQFQPTEPEDSDNLYTWTFGDGNGSNEYDPEHTYAAQGTYEVQLITENECGADTTQQMISIIFPPEAAFTTDDVTQGCAPLTITFTNQSVNAATYAWSFPGGNPAASTVANPTVTYDSPGAYAVQLTATNAAGESVSLVEDYVTVLPAPSGAYSFTTDVLEVQFTSTVNDTDTYLWDFGDGNGSTMANPAHTYTAGGTYTVVLMITNACGSVTITETVTVLPPAPVAQFATDDATEGCAPLTITFLNQSTNAATYAWSFPGGNPAASTEANPTVTYDSPGTYAVQLTATNAAGESVSLVEDYVTVLPAPSGSFSFSTNLLEAQFTSMANDTDTYLWDFGDGNGSTMANPAHTYSAGGTYTVFLMITNACGSVTITETVTVLPPAPVAQFTTDDATEGCAPLTITFLNQSSNAATYAWSFPGGNPAASTEANPTVTYDSPGTYAVQLTATNAAGESVSLVEDYVTVLPAPSGSFSFSTNLLEAQFTSMANDTDTYLWDFDDGNGSTLANPTHGYEIGGTYTVTLMMTNECGTVIITQEVTVSRPIPEVDFSTEDMREGCAPLTITYTNVSENATSYAWTFPGGEPATSTEEHPTVTYSTPGVYDVQLNATNETGTNSLVVQAYVTVLGPPTGGFNYTTDELEVQFISDDQDVDAHAWDFGDGTGSDLINPLHAYAASGTYTVTLVITNACGNTTITQTISVDVNAVPNVAFTTMGDRVGCPPFEVQFVNQSTGADTYQWTFPGGTPDSSTEPDPIVTYNTPGTYFVNLTATNANGDSMLTQLDYIDVLPLPFGNFTTELDMLTATFTSTTQNVDGYSWQFGDGATSNEANPVHTYAEPGDYLVVLSVENECAIVSIESTITVIITSMEALTETAQWALYPNPTHGPLWLATTDWPTATTTQVVVFNALGERLSTQVISLAAGDNRVPLLLDLPAGVYWLRLEGKQLAGGMRKVIMQ